MRGSECTRSALVTAQTVLTVPGDAVLEDDVIFYCCNINVSYVT